MSLEPAVIFQENRFNSGKVIDIIKESGKNPTIFGEECGIIKGNDNDGYIIMDANMND